MKRVTAFTWLVVLALHAGAQDAEKGTGEYLLYARQVVDTLASPFMQGRGYVNEGDRTAAKYIADEFKKAGLKSFKSTYYQKFSFAINTFPGEVSLQAGSRKLVPGTEFLVGSSSGFISGEYELLWLDKSTAGDKKKLKKLLKQKNEQKIVVVDTAGIQDAFKKAQSWIGKAAGVIYIREKLTWDMSQAISKQFSFEVIRGALAASDKKAAVKIQCKYIPDYTSQNVIGYVEGSQHADSFIVFTAHYDHLGKMGPDVYFPGANDNASGIAMLLSLARHYAKPGNKPRYSIAFIAFSAEEVGLLGSQYFVSNPCFPLKRIKFLVNMDILGTGDEGITVVNATVFDSHFKQLQKLNAQGSYLKEIKPRGKAAISDHYFFTYNGVPSFFIYTLGGIKAYHDVYDKRETLPLTEFEDLFILLTEFTSYIESY
ncbi:MAG: M20/M25/M40 family metallo-hydrolase [Bacteroidota bacterium]